MAVLKPTVLKAAICIAVVVALLYGSLFLLSTSNRFRLFVEAELSSRSGHQIRVGELRFNAPFKFIANEVTAAKSTGVLFSSPRITLTLNLTDLFSKTIHRLTLEAPVLHLDLQELLQRTAQASPALAIRHLNIENGVIVLTTTAADSIRFAAIDVDAQNLNFGRGSGISVRADVPWLDAEAELFMQLQKQETLAELVLRQRRVQSHTEFAQQAKESLRLRGKLATNAGGEADLTLAGTFDDLVIASKPLTGSLEARAIPNPDFTQAELAGRMEIADLAGIMGTAGLAAKGPAVATVKGTYRAADKLLAVTAFQLDSPLGTAQGKGHFTADGDFTAKDGSIIVRKLPWESVKVFFPEPLNRWAYRGVAGAELSFNGPWRSLQINGTVSSDAVAVNGADFSLAHVAINAPVRWNFSSLASKDFSLTAKSLNLGGSDRLQAAAGSIQIDGSLTYGATEPVAVSARVQLAGGRFASADNTRIGENLDLGGTIDLVANKAAGPTRLNGKLSLSRGEILSGKFFADLAGQRPILYFDGDYHGRTDSVALRRAGLTLASIGSLEITGSISRLAQAPTVALDAYSESLNAAGVFDFFFRDTFKRQYALIDRLRVGGLIGLELHASGDWHRLAAMGRVTLQGGELGAQKSDWQLDSIALTLPFTLVYPAGSGNRSAARPGILAVRGGRFASRSLPPLTTSLSLTDNTLVFHQPLNLSIFGGDIEIDKLAWPDIVKDPQALSFALEAKNLQLQELTDAFGWPRFSGTLGGSIPQVRSSENTLRSEGRIQVDLFGGHLEINRMEVENFFSMIPALKLDARFRDIRLEQASETFAFGKISGILEGTVKDLIIIDGQPAQFYADIRTVQGQGSNQWISVEALNKITVLSSGQDSAPLYGGLAGFFENFRYSKLGFKASLKNDRLILRGVESRDGKEFLVVGSLLPPTVNIISHTQEIGFSELMRRLERVNSSKPETP